MRLVVVVFYPGIVTNGVASVFRVCGWGGGVYLTVDRGGPVWMSCCMG
jgi:hypothetical protein